uniref:Uncharacterized protein LOC104265615 n=1 Tax=Phallusia mammillata TaxID=59560 RepID=A0A6F9DJL6_9ASCI|nr:uncharacterized protein LOC104265615 [Phallusia mammillata]
MLGTKFCSTTAYHPQSNGLAERLHRRLKAALKSYENPTDWYSNLGLVLLGIRASHNVDLDASPAEMVSGKKLRLPGEFFEEVESSETKSDYAKRLTSFMSGLRFSPRREQPARRSYIDKNLQTSSHVFVKVSGHKPPLHPSYTGPFKVLERHNKYFVLAMFGKENSVSIDRIKVARLPNVVSNDDNSEDTDTVVETVPSFVVDTDIDTDLTTDPLLTGETSSALPEIPIEQTDEKRT